MKRSERLKALREIIKNIKVSSQDSLAAELRKKGFKVTQATISRDIQYLNLIKVRDAGKNEFYALSSQYQANPQVDFQKMKTKFKETVISVERAGNIVVVKTNPGEAQGVGASIDGSNLEEILGTVAGDDTVICIVDKNKNAGKILDLFRSF